MAYTSQYPPAQNNTYVNATTQYAGGAFQAYFATDPAMPLTGSRGNTSWVSLQDVFTNQRFHIDLGSAFIIRRIYFENGHSAGAGFEFGAKNFTVQGSNDAAAFAEFTYAVDTNWTNITADISLLQQHVASDQSDPQYALLTNTTAYRYYAIKFADQYSGNNFINVRRIELQTEDGFSPGGGGRTAAGARTGASGKTGSGSRTGAGARTLV